MWIDAERLKSFYRSDLGILTKRYVHQNLAQLWPQTKGEVVVGFGFANPYLSLFDGEADRIISLMPAPQGALQWPVSHTKKDLKNQVVLVEECLWPLPDRSVDRLIICHALEFSHRTQDILKEAWRVLRESGELIVVTPNRRGAWAQTTTTPLGYGTPYTGHQLYDVLERSSFHPQKPVYCLYAPPSERLLTMKLSSTIEKYGSRFSKKLGGVLIFPARKQVYALTPRGTPAWSSKSLKPTTAS